MRVALAGLVALAVAMGIGRFAFTPILPMMQADSGLTLVQGGWLASANYAGYLAGALWATALPPRSPWSARLGLAVIAAVTLAMGLVHHMAAWLVLRTAAGFASAWVLVYVSAWSLEKLAPLGRPFLSGVVYAGVGSGVAAAGLACLALMAQGASSGSAWILLGVLSFVALAALMPVFGRTSFHARTGEEARLWSAPALRLIACYGAYGFGYIIPATFLPAMAREMLDDPVLFGWAWPVFGATAAMSTVAVAALGGRFDNRRVWFACHLVMALGVAAPLVLPPLAGIVVAAVCVGGTFVVVTMVGLQEARRLAGAGAARLIGALTAAFAAGQIIGPAFASAALVAGASLHGALAAAAIALVLSAFALLGQ